VLFAIVLGISAMNYAVFDVSPLLFLPEVPLLAFLSSLTSFSIIRSTWACSGSGNATSSSRMGSALLDFGVLASPVGGTGSILTGVDTVLLLRLRFCVCMFLFCLLLTTYCLELWLRRTG
jgi:hypothetical protein